MIPPGQTSACPAEQEVADKLNRLRFRFPLRKYQTEILDLVNEKVSDGEREVHVVAPPGAGKTIIGLQMVLNFKRPSLILTPNTTIQAQWSQKLSLFVPPELDGLDTGAIIGTHEDRPLKPITVLTYQILSTPGREQEYLSQLAQKEWVNELRSSRSMSVGEAELRILEIMQNNPRAHQKEMSRHLSRVRRKLTDVLKLEEVLHKNALELLQSLRRQDVGLVIFDECHHLTDYWAAIMSHLIGMLDNPIVVALTGTPPEGKSRTQENRYASLVGNIDYQVPTPALVRERGLAPFQDLVYITQPTAKEFAFLESQHEDFHALVKELVGEKDDCTIFSTTLLPTQRYQVNDQNGNVSELMTWVLQRAIDATEVEGWEEFSERRAALARAILRCLWHYRLPIPSAIAAKRQFSLADKTPFNPKLDMAEDEIFRAPNLDDWMLLLEDFASHKLKLSQSQENHRLFERIRKAAGKLGFGISERGLRRQASPVDRVLAFSESKARAASEILAVEYRSLGDHLRAIIVTDFERMSYTGLHSTQGVLNEDSGGAAGVLKQLLASPIAAYLNPCLVTGSLLLIDCRIKDQFASAANQFLAREGSKLKLNVTALEGQPYAQVSAEGSEWESKLYVRLATELFESGISKCLIGTRGLFGEGWDSQALNTLIDLTTTTAPVSVKQLRGRTLRVQSKASSSKELAAKVANNWDIVCVAPTLEKGLNDYGRFVRKHETFFGIADDGQIERGVGHVHPDLSELTGHEVFARHAQFNQEMAVKAMDRNRVYELWRVGAQYQNEMVVCLEVSNLPAPHLTPPFLKTNWKHKEHAAFLRGWLRGISFDFIFCGAVLSAVLAYCLRSLAGTVPSYVVWLTAAVPLLIGAIYAHKHFKHTHLRLRTEMCSKQNAEDNLHAIASAVLSALKRLRLLPRHIESDNITVSSRSNGCFRVFLDNIDYVHSKVFVDALQETMRPLTDQALVVPRYVFQIEQADNARKPIASQDDLWARFFNLYKSARLEPVLSAYHPVPQIFAKSEKGKEAFLAAWNKHVSEGELNLLEDNRQIINKYVGPGPTLAKRILWE